MELEGTKAIFYALEKLADGKLQDITGKFKTVSIADDTDNSQIREFQSTVHTFFDNVNPNGIGILKRMAKGKFASSPLSFKLEGLIQCYQKCEIELVSPLTLTAYYKNNDFVLDTAHKYQINAARLAQYLMNIK